MLYLSIFSPIPFYLLFTAFLILQRCDTFCFACVDDEGYFSQASLANPLMRRGLVGICPLLD